VESNTFLHAKQSTVLPKLTVTNRKKILTTNFQFHLRTNGLPLGVCCHTSVIPGMASGDALQHQAVRTDDDSCRNVLTHQHPLIRKIMRLLSRYPICTYRISI